MREHGRGEHRLVGRADAEGLALRARIAERLLVALGAPTTHEFAERVGAFTLRPAQRRTLHAVLASIREFGGALLADPPGTGKTVIALAAARRLHDGETLVIAPASLRSQWSDAAARAAVPIRFESVEALSRGRSPVHAEVIVVDEAHHVRTPASRRHERLADACVRASVVLLSATPVVNRRADRDALLGLFLGERAARLSDADASRCVVRQHETDNRPRVRRLRAIGRGTDVEGLAVAIAALPPPLPVVEGTAATALIVISLAMAWRSSLAALDAALRRRLQRGEAMADLLRAGRAPSHAALRHWVLHDDATQLAIASLLDGPAPARSQERTDALRTLECHLRAVRSLRERLRPHRATDATARAAAILALAQEHPARRIVVFARHAETVRALFSALRHEAGVVAIVGSRVRAAAGRWSRDEVLRAVGPRARPLRRDDPRAIRIVLATDVVAEGVEMQGVGIVVHADLPWTPARLEQRLGRVTRVGSAEKEVLEAHFAAPRGARSLIALGARLRGKASARRDSVRDGRARGEVLRLLQRWVSDACGSGRDRASEPIAAPRDPPMLTKVDARRTGFIAASVHGGETVVMAGERHERHWRVGDAPRLLLRVLRRVDRAGGSAAPAIVAITAGSAGATAPADQAEPAVAPHLARIIAVAERALERHVARALVGATGAPAGAHASGASRGTIRTHLARRLTRVRARLARLLEHTPPLARAALAERHSAMLLALDGPIAAALERRVDALLRAPLDDEAFARRLRALLADRGHSREKSRPGGPGRLDTLLVLSPSVRSATPPAPAPTSASPGTAAPR